MSTIDKDFVVKHGLQVTEKLSANGLVIRGGDPTIFPGNVSVGNSTVNTQFTPTNIKSNTANVSSIQITSAIVGGPNASLNVANVVSIVSGNTTVNTTAVTSDSANVKSLSVSNSITGAANIVANNVTAVQFTIGNTTINGSAINTSILNSNSIAVSGNATISETLSANQVNTTRMVSGNTIANTTSVYADGLSTKTLNVDGSITGNSSILTAPNTSVSGTLAVSGNSTFANISTASIVSTGNAQITGTFGSNTQVIVGNTTVRVTITPTLIDAPAANLVSNNIQGTNLSLSSGIAIGSNVSANTSAVSIGNTTYGDTINRDGITIVRGANTTTITDRIISSNNAALSVQTINANTATLTSINVSGSANIGGVPINSSAFGTATINATANNLTVNSATITSANVSGNLDVTGNGTFGANGTHYSRANTTHLYKMNGFIYAQNADYLVTNGEIIEWHVALGNGSTINSHLGSYFSKTVSAANTFVINWNNSGSNRVGSFVLELTNGGSAALTWPASVKWAGGAPPNFTSSGVDIITFFTRNNGTTWYATPILNFQ